MCQGPVAGQGGGWGPRTPATIHRNVCPHGLGPDSTCRRGRGPERRARRSVAPKHQNSDFGHNLTVDCFLTMRGGNDGDAVGALPWESRYLHPDSHAAAEKARVGGWHRPDSPPPRHCPPASHGSSSPYGGPGRLLRGQGRPCPFPSVLPLPSALVPSKPAVEDPRSRIHGRRKEAAAAQPPDSEPQRPLPGSERGTRQRRELGETVKRAPDRNFWIFKKFSSRQNTFSY